MSIGIASRSQKSISGDNVHSACQSWHGAGVASSSRGLDSSPTPFKFVEVLAALGRPDAALAVLRARAPLGQAGKLSCNQAFQEAQTALAVRLQCGVFTEACSEVGCGFGILPCCSCCMCRHCMRQSAWMAVPQRSGSCMLCQVFQGFTDLPSVTSDTGNCSPARSQLTCRQTDCLAPAWVCIFALHMSVSLGCISVIPDHVSSLARLQQPAIFHK